MLSLLPQILVIILASWVIWESLGYCDVSEANSTSFWNVVLNKIFGWIFFFGKSFYLCEQFSVFSWKLSARDEKALKLCNRLFIFPDEFTLRLSDLGAEHFEPSGTFNNLNKFEFLWKFRSCRKLRRPGRGTLNKQPRNNFTSFC